MTVNSLLIASAVYDRKNIFPDLPECENDIVALQAALKAYTNFPQETMRLLGAPNGITKEEILTVIERLSCQSGSTDTIFFYYTGHGIEKGDESFIVPSDCDGTPATAISHSQILFQLRKNGSKVVFIIDSCFAGNGIKQNSLDKIHGLFSSQGRQASNLYAQRNLSLFTYYFIEALKSDISKNGELNFGEVVRYTEKRMMAWVKNNYYDQQIPETSDDDFSLVVKSTDVEMLNRLVVADYPKFTIAEIDASDGIKKRLSCRVIFKPEVDESEYLSLIPIIQRACMECGGVVNDGFHRRQYFIHDDANEIFMFLYKSPYEWFNNIVFLRTLWCSESLPKGMRAMSISKETISGIEYIYNDKERELGLLFQEHVGNYDELAPQISEYIKQAKEIADQLICRFREFESSLISEQEFEQSVLLSKEDFEPIEDYYAELPIFPLTLKTIGDLGDRFMAAIGNMIQINSSQTYNTDPLGARIRLTKQQIKLYEQDLSEIYIESQRIGFDFLPRR